MVIKENSLEKRKIIKNLVAFGVSFLLIFSAVNSILSVQSVLNQDNGLGVISSTVGFSVQLFTCLVLPQFITEIIGYKWTMILSELSYLLYVSSNLYPRYITILSGSVFMGFAQSLAWTVLGIYMQILSKNYSKISGSSFLAIQNLFFGIFGSIFMLSSCLGSFMIALILKPEKNSKINNSFNNTLNDSEPYDYSRYCGFNNCPNDKLPGESSKPSLLSVYILCGSLISLLVLSILITFIFVDNVKEIPDDESIQIKIKKLSLCSRFKQEFQNIFKLLKSIDLFLLMPIPIYIGFELTFLWAEFNRAFVSCLANVNFIGWTNIVYGLFGAFFSFFFGYIAKYTQRFPIFIFVLTISIGIGLFVVIWTPHANLLSILFYIYIAFSLVQSVTNSQIRGIYGAQFPNNNSAFSAVTLFQTFGFIAGSASSIYLCTKYKTYIYLSVSVLSLITYGALNIKNTYNEQKKEKEIEYNKNVEMIGLIGKSNLQKNSNY